ncbi:hypothetical protein Ddye_007631 [Dipteronia dyeriana]|uniref:MADS-box domain-containing protein n=1 Tax=Dipteronia dyeriana TaxID=168575 RepID=A0AAD9XKS5_9ROSI|nr:hypothetical protein Ddye_007631 [Dipteronia dyeriana]
MAPAETQKIRKSKLMSFKNEVISIKKRKSTLKKKAAQLSTLCNAEVCMVCFGPDKTVETWPENRSNVLDLIGKYGGLSEKEREKAKQKYNLVGFLSDKKRKMYEKLNKKRKNRDESVKNYDPGSEFPAWDERLDLFSEENLVGLCGCLDSKLQELREQIRVLQMKNKKDKKVDEFQNHKVCFNHPSYKNLNYDLSRLINDDNCLYDQQINSEFGRLENLAFLGGNYNNNHVGMVNMNNNLGLDKNNSLGFAHQSNMGLMRTEESVGLIGESSNYFQSVDHFMPSHPSTYLQFQEVLPISMRPQLFSDQFSCFG